MAVTQLTTATILFCDVVGSTEQRVRLGDNAADALHARVDAAMRNAVTDGGGTIVKGEGDGVMAVFASATAAVDAAVHIQRRIDAAPLDQAVEVRVGLASGDVSEAGGDYFGLPVVTAARLCGAAVPGQILCSAIVQVLAGSRPACPISPVGALELKGIDGPVEVFEVGWAPATSTPPLPRELRVPDDDPFVGRADQLRVLHDGLADAADGLTMVFVAGEPGVGKTRLVAEFARHAHADGATVLFGRNDEDLGVAFQPWIEALERHLLSLDDDRLHATLDRLGDAAPELGRILPALRSRAPDLPPPLELSGAHIDGEDGGLRHRLFDAIVAALTAVETSAPTILVLDDLHWGGRETLFVLRHLLRTGQELPLLVIGTYRDTDLARTHPLAEFLADLQRSHPGVRITLGGLAETDIRQLASDHDDIDEARLGELSTATGGNAFFVRALLRHLDEAEAGERVPEGIREVVGRRLSRLGDDANEILALAAVAGSDFDVTVLEHAAGRDVLPALEAALDAGLVEEADQGTCRFQHALVRQTLLEELTSMRRTRNHGLLAASIEAVHAKDLEPHLSDLAHHLTESARTGSITHAVEVSRKAAAVAFDRLAYDEAEQILERALDVVDLGGPSSLVHRPGVLHDLLQVAVYGDDDDRAHAALAEAVEACHAVGDTETLARVLRHISYWRVASSVTEDQLNLYMDWCRAALDQCSPHQRVERFLILSALSLLEGIAGQGHGHLDELIELFYAVEDNIEIVTAAFLVGTQSTVTRGDSAIASRVVRLLEAGNEYQQANAARLRVAAAVVGGDRSALRGPDAELVAEAVRRLGPASLFSALSISYAHAHRISAGHLDLGSEPDHGQMVPDQAPSDHTRLRVALERGDADQIDDLLGRLETGSLLWSPSRFAGLLRALCALQRGDAEPARSTCEAYGHREWSQLGTRYNVVGVLSELAAETSNRRAAARLLEELDVFAGRLVISQAASYIEGSKARFAGMAASVLGDHDAAVASLREAVAFEDQIGAHLLVVRSQHWLGRALLARDAPGDTDEGRAVLEQSLAGAERIGMNWVAQRTRELLA